MTTNETPEMAQRKQQVVGVFSRAAATYDQAGPRYLSHFGRRLVEAARIPAGSRVLDAATGRGAVLFPAAEAVGPQGLVIGIDLSEEMVLATEQELASRGFTASAEVCRMDAENLDFPDESFDYVLCGFAIFFFPRLDEALAEFRRVLKPNGHVCVSTWGTLYDPQFQWIDELVEKYLPPDPAAARPPEFGMAAGVTSILEAAGFVQVEVREELAEFVYASEEEYWSVWWSHGMRGTLEAIERTKGAEGLASFKSDVFQKLGQIKQADGIHEPFQVLIGSGTKAQG